MSNKKKQVQTEKTWFRVKAPQVWRPKPGEELIGVFLGTQVKVGQFGEYNAHMIKTHGANVKYVSGAMTDDLFAMLDSGSKVKLIFIGMQPVHDSDREYKLFELYTEEEIEFKLVVSA